MELFCLSVHAAYIRRVPPFLGKMVSRTRPKRSLFIFHLLFTPTFSLSLSRPFRFIFLTFFLFFKDIFNVSEAVGFLVHWLKLATRRFGQKHGAPAARVGEESFSR